MRKIYTLVLLSFSLGQVFGQCPVIDGAMIKPCINTAGEGINEFVFFTTTEAGTAGDYILYYGSNTPPKTSPTATLSGNNAATKIGTGVVTASGGCTLVQVTSAATPIPAGSRVVLIPYNLDQNYDLAGICKGGSVYVVYINITVSPSNNWMANGTLANSPSGNRYIQVVKGANNCTDNIRIYKNSWPTSVEGNAVSWVADGTASYFNNGCVDIVTPVKLHSFTVTGNGNNANLVWKTNTEINTLKFEIERSVDAAHFSAMASIAATGHSSQVQSYSHVDINIPTGVNYYRLKMVDKDGSFSYSPIVKIANNKNRFEITNLYPRPAGNTVNVSWNAPKYGNTILSVFDMSGRMMIKKELTSTAGMNNAVVDLSNLPKGNYQLKLEKDAVVQTMALIKQ